MNYTFRMHDPRVGRFFAIDPLTKKYPFYSPYAFSGNEVINSRELEGLEPTECIGAMKVMQTKAHIIATNSPEKAKELIGNYERNAFFAVGGSLTAGAAPAIYSSIGSAYATYTTWFAGTSFSAYLSTGTGASIFASLESQYTLSGVFQSSTADRVVNSTTNFFGQVADKKFNFNEINYAQPLAAFVIGNKFLENVAESSLNLNFKGELKLNSFNTFTESFYGNVFGDLLNEKFQGITKPVYDFSKALKPAIEIYGGTGIEVLEAKFSDKIVKPLNKQLNTSESIKNMNKSN